MTLPQTHDRLLNRYHDGQTSVAENQQVAALLNEYPQYQQQLDDMQQLRSALQSGFVTPRISTSLASRLLAIPHNAQQHIIARMAGGWALAASIMLIFSGLTLFGYHQNTAIDPISWQLDRMALGQMPTQYSVELTDNHKDLQLASLLIADATTLESSP